MTAMLPLQVRAADGFPTCIIDARLALAPGGLVLALQLSRIIPCWLTRRFWELVDGAYFYRSYPGELAADGDDDSGVDAIVDALVTWHTAWLNGGLEGSFHWIGDARRESALPIHCCGEVISRYERLAESFPAANEAERAVEPLALCGQEAFALAAALTVDAPIILTVVPARRDRTPILAVTASAFEDLIESGAAQGARSAGASLAARAVRGAAPHRAHAGGPAQAPVVDPGRGNGRHRRVRWIFRRRGQCPGARSACGDGG